MLLTYDLTFLEAGKGSKSVLGSTPVVVQLSFSMLPSVLTFDFDLILGAFFTFGGPNGLTLGFRYCLKTVLGSTHVVEQLLFCIVP